MRNDFWKTYFGQLFKFFKWLTQFKYVVITFSKWLMNIKGVETL